MQNQLVSKNIASGVTLKCVADKKFRSNIVSVKLLIKNSGKNLAALALIPSVLSYTNANYPSSDKMNTRLNELYGATLFSSCGQRGEMYEISISCEYILDKYTLSEKIADDVVKILIDCITNPALEDGAFVKEEFDIRKNDLLDAIDAEINDKTSYALSLAYPTIYNGELASQKYYGTREEVEALTPRDVYTAYEYVLNNALVEIFFTGGGDFESQISLFNGVFKDRPDLKISYYSPSRAKSEPIYDEKIMDVSQANMVLAFKTESNDHFANRLMTSLYGGGYSKLFEIVREKLSLCYFCDAGYSEVKQTMTVVSAVDFENIDAARNEIINQLSLLAQGDFSDEELENKKHQMAASLRASYDSISALSSWDYLCTLRGKDMTVDEYIFKISALTRDDVINAAKSMKLDTVFVLRGGAN